VLLYRIKKGVAKLKLVDLWIYNLRKKNLLTTATR